WQQLTEKTAKSEARASARTRAGHKARNKQDSTSIETDTPAGTMTTGHPEYEVFGNDEHENTGTEMARTSVEDTNTGLDSGNSDVATGNNGSEPDVDHINTGSQGGDGSSAEATNNGPASVVARSNATYYQETSTTTTTTTADQFAEDRDRDQDPGALD